METALFGPDSVYITMRGKTKTFSRIVAGGGGVGVGERGLSSIIFEMHGAQKRSKLYFRTSHRIIARV